MTNCLSQRNRSLLPRVVALVIVAWSSTVEALPVRWLAAEGGNNHWYEAVYLGPFTTWQQARDAALARGGHLVTMSSAEENAFVYELIRHRPELWSHTAINNALGPWIGCVQDSSAGEPADGWGWVTGEPFAYQNWYGFGTGSAEPAEGEGGNADFVHFFMGGALEGPFWNDASESAWDIRGYVVEYPTLACAQGDADGNFVVNFADITAVLTNFGAVYSPTGPGDANGNGVVNFADVTEVLANFGQSCP